MYILVRIYLLHAKLAVPRYEYLGTFYTYLTIYTLQSILYIQPITYNLYTY